ncbi:MAG: VWA domain-containing protein [Chromatiales bacterium]|jgi:Ca-activated chloride channel family protein
MRQPALSILTVLLVIGALGPWAADRLQAAEREQVMIVLDASGSMWQRVGGTEKIVIAREVLGEILGDWPAGTDLGLVAYGHRRKGDCGDIETVVPLGPPDMNAVRRTVNAIQPKGKTPLSAAVLEAARALRYSEERATVILVSDGKETCDMDPCAVGRELERTGVDFTAHVIGFDIADDERAQLQCLAEATGGEYFDAREAGELKTALAAAVKKVEMKPDRVSAVLAEGGEPLTDPDIRWTAEPIVGGKPLSAVAAQIELPAGSGGYRVQASLGEASGEAPVEVEKGKSRTHLVVLDAGRLTLRASAIGPEGPIADPAVEWTVQDLGEEREVASFTGAETSLYLDRGAYGISGAYQGESRQEVVRLEPGADERVELRFEIFPAELAAPASAPAGSFVDVAWEGPDGKGDYIAVSDPDSPAPKSINYASTERGSPARVRMPDEAGVYELRYVAGQSRSLLARTPIEVTPVSASLEAPAEAAAGSYIEIAWEGPDNKGDYVSVAAPDSADRKSINYASTDRGSPARVRMPDEAGVYELRYVLGQSRTALARRPITVTPVSASLEAPTEAAAGSYIEIAWEGPDNKGDYVSVAAPDSADRKSINYASTDRGSPARVRMPDEAGVYELRYVLGQSRTALARRPITVTAVTASLEAPTEAAAGSYIDIAWEGPDNKGDYVSVAAPDAADRKSINYAYTERGSPARVRMPDEPGVYELRYVSGQSRTALSRRPITVTGVEAALRSLDLLPAGEKARVDWKGPDNKGDYISIAKPDQPDRKSVKYVYTDRGSPAALSMPDEPGMYELRYVMGQSRTVLVRRPVQVVPAATWGNALAGAAKGQLELRAMDAAAGQPLTGGVAWTLYAVEGGEEGIRRLDEAQPKLSLAPGIYRANATADGNTQTVELILNPGESIVRTVTFGSP